MVSLSGKHILVIVLTLALVGIGVIFFKIISIMGDPSYRVTYYIRNDSRDTIYLPAEKVNIWFNTENGPKYADTIRINQVKYLIFPPGKDFVYYSEPTMTTSNNTLKNMQLANDSVEIFLKSKGIKIPLNDTIYWSYTKLHGNMEYVRHIKESELYKK